MIYTLLLTQSTLSRIAVRICGLPQLNKSKGVTYMGACIAMMVSFALLERRQDDDEMDILRIEQEQENAPRRRRRRAEA